MQEENVTQDLPVQEPVVEEVQQEPQETQPEPQAEQVQESETPQVEQEVVSEEPKQVEQPDVNYDLSRFYQPQQEVPQFTPDEEGFIDPNAFYNKVLADAEARIEQKLAFQESERRAWNSIESKYPEIKEDAELRELVNAQRLADVARGGKGDLNEIASKVLGKFQSYQAKGKVQAQVSEKVQKSASLESNTANNIDSNKTDDLLDRMASGDKSAADQLISEWLESGKL